MDKRPLRERSPLLRFHATWKRDGFTTAFKEEARQFVQGWKRRLSWLASWVFWRRVILSCAVLVTLVALFYGVENWRGHRAWQEHKQAVEASGVSLNYEDYIPAPIPDAENMAMTPVFKPLFDGTVTNVNADADARTNYFLLTQGLSLRNHGGVGPVRAIWQESRPWNLHDWQINLRGWKNMSREEVDPELFAKYETWGRDPELEFPRTEEAQSPAEDVLMALTKFDPQFDAFREAAQRPNARWPIVYEDRWGALLPHLSMIHEVSTIQALRAAALLELGRAEEAEEALALAARFAQSLAVEPFTISEVVRAKQMQVLASTVWVGMVGNQWTTDNLKRFQDWFAPADYERQLMTSYGMERAAWAQLWAGSSDELDRFSRLQAEYFGSHFLEIALNIVPSGWWHQNAVNVDKHLSYCENTVLAVLSRGALTNADTGLPELDAPRPYKFVVQLLANWHTWSSNYREWRLTAPVRRIQGIVVVHTACAVERFRLERGRLPETLAALVPEYLDEVPLDYMDGQPLRYRVDGPTSFRVWSIGLDFENNGGEPVSDESNRGDISWRVER